MPRKKQTATSVPGMAPARLTCPACKSEISADGSTLHSLSKYLEELIETAGDVDKLEKALEAMEAKLTAAKQEAEKAKEKVEAAPKTKAEEKANVGKQEQQGKPKSNSWW